VYQMAQTQTVSIGPGIQMIEILLISTSSEPNTREQVDRGM